ncbi:MAG: serine hydrolase [Bacteroidota bacterium]
MKCLRGILILVGLYVGSLFSQGATTLSLKGTILDAKTQNPIAFAALYAKASGRGTLSNEQGKFELVLQAPLSSDTVCFSILGYQTTCLSVKELRSTKVIAMEENPFELEEVTLTGYTALGVLKTAMDSIPTNYYESPYVSDEFYRLKILEGTRHLQLSEAAYQVYHTQPLKQNRVKLLKARNVKDQEVLRDMIIGMKSKALATSDLVFDPDESPLFNPALWKRYEFFLDGKVPFAEEEAFRIRFQPKIGQKRMGYEGTCYISTATFAVLEADFCISPSTLPYTKFGSAATRALLGVMGMSMTINKECKSFAYQKIGQKYYLRNSAHDGSYKLSQEGGRKTHQLEIGVIRAVTDLDLEVSAPFPKEEVLNKENWISPEGTFYDTLFWENTTVVVPDVDYQTVAHAIYQRNASSQLKERISEKVHRLPKDVALRLDTLLAAYHEQGNFQGNVLIAHENKVVFRKSYLADSLEGSIKSRFRIGSSSKPFTAMAILQLAEAEKLSLTDSLGKFFPDYLHKSLTLKQLLTHQSGLNDFLSHPDYAPQVINNSFSDEELRTRFFSDSLLFQPDSGFSYSNSGYVLLAQVVEHVTGKPFEEVLETQVFSPLGMNNTFVGGQINGQKTIPAFLYSLPEPVYPMDNVRGAGGVISTVDDLLRWTQAIQRGDLLSPVTYQRMLTPSAEYRDWGAGYGYGWMIDKYLFERSDKHPRYYHPGTDMGFYSMVLTQPDAGISIILLNNTGDFPRFDLTEVILEVLN